MFVLFSKEIYCFDKHCLLTDLRNGNALYFLEVSIGFLKYFLYELCIETKMCRMQKFSFPTVVYVLIRTVYI